MFPFSKTNKKRVFSGLSLAVVGVALSACVTQPPSFGEGIDFREARYNEISAMRDYRDCRDHALELDREAQTNHDAAKYLASARMIEKCEAKLGPDVADVAVDERMRAYALTNQNHLKGGDVEQAASIWTNSPAIFKAAIFILPMDHPLCKPWKFCWANAGPHLSVNIAMPTSTRT